ncbi:MAG: glutathione S-transferase family protein [Litorimonas sp.]
MITLHHLENSQSIRILWLLEEIGAPYAFEMYDRDPKTMLAPQVYKDLSPLGTAPVVTDGTLALSESNAIIDYIVDKSDRPDLRPAADDPIRADYLFWFHTAQGTLQPMATFGFVLGLATQRSPFLVRPIISKVEQTLKSVFIEPRLKAVLTNMETQLSNSEFLAGDRFTAADIAMGYTLHMLKMRGGLADEYPSVLDYVTRMEARPAWQAALEKDGKFEGVPS